MVAIELREKRPGPIGANENACTIDACIGLELLSLLTALPQWIAITSADVEGDE